MIIKITAPYSWLDLVPRNFFVNGHLDIAAFDMWTYENSPKVLYTVKRTRREKLNETVSKTT